MADAIAHRGPDAEGFWCATGVGLAHRRLSIIDLAGGDQPIGNEDGSMQVVFNGEIYNYRELRDWLTGRGHQFRTAGDTEVLVHLYEEHGPALVERLRGMFAFALWDARRRRLVLARDRVGIKPLYVYRDGEKLLFGSELKAILAYPGIPREVDAQALEDYLAFGCVVGGRSIFRRIQKLPAAHVLVVSSESWEASPKRYWELRFEADERLSEDDWQEAIRAKVAESVQRHLIADVPVGAFLSGGLDSSVVVCEAAGEIEPQRHRDTETKAEDERRKAEVISLSGLSAGIAAPAGRCGVPATEERGILQIANCKLQIANWATPPHPSPLPEGEGSGAVPSRSERATVWPDESRANEGTPQRAIVNVGLGRPTSALSTFSMGFHEAGFSELPYARQVAERFGTRHVEEVVTADAAKLVEELAFYFDEPFADSSAVPTFLVSRLARRHVKVVLSGDGGDEAFGGYARYAHDLNEAVWRERLPGWLRRGAVGPLGAVWPKADWLPRVLRAKTRLTNLALEADAAYANTLTLARLPGRRKLLSGDVRAELNGHRPEEVIIEAFRRGLGSVGNALCGVPGFGVQSSDGPAALTLALSRRERENGTARSPFPTGPIENPKSEIQNDDYLAGMLSADTAVLLADDFLTKVDRASMAHGLEVRPPLVDHELLELAARVPSRFKVRGGETKWIVKRAYEDRLPREAVWRAKHGFEIPVDRWLRGPLREMFEESVLTPSARGADFIDRREVSRLYRQHLSGVGRHGAVLWSMLILAKWAERWL